MLIYVSAKLNSEKQLSKTEHRQMYVGLSYVSAVINQCRLVNVGLSYIYQCSLDSSRVKNRAGRRIQAVIKNARQIRAEQAKCS